MDGFERICRDIKEVKIQGARAVAEAAVRALLIRHDKKSVAKLISLRPTEPCLQNAVNFVLLNENIREGTANAIKILRSDDKIAEIGAGLIKNGMTIFTHCHSSAVVSIMLKAKKQGKKFRVFCTETRPLFQGRITAGQLAKAKIPVTMFVDSAAKIAIKKADIVFFGSDAITQTHVYNKIGSELFAIIAAKYNVPVYIATTSWKFDAKSIYGKEPNIEERSPKEVWPNAPKGVEISNFAFEKIGINLIKGIISELGLLSRSSFVRDIRKAYPFMFN